MDLPFELDSNRTEGPLHVRLYNEYRTAILTGRLAPGQRVPSTRHLARQLCVSRTTVSRTYDELIAEGYLESSRGSGTFVCRKLPDETIARPIENPAEDWSAPAHLLSDYGSRLLASIEVEEEPLSREYNFYSWQPGFDSFPADLWSKLVARHARTCEPKTLDYQRDWMGLPALREAIAGYLARSRAVQCTADDVLITSGSQQSFLLAARVLLNPGDCAAVEDPGYHRIREVWTAEGAKVIPAPVDGNGVMVSHLELLPRPPKLVYVTPSHQFPTGAVLPLNRRLELVSWARENDVFLLEDDYDSEYRYAGRPFPSLQGLDQHGTVLYTGTFSKVLFPSLRLGYIVAPKALRPVLMRAKRVMDRHCPAVEQLALAEFIREGHLDRHLRRTRLLYDRRRQALVRSLTQAFGPKVLIRGENAGIHILVRFDTPHTDEHFLALAEAAGVILTSSRPYYLSTPPRGEFLMGYACMTPERIEEGVSRLAAAVQVENRANLKSSAARLSGK